MIRTAHLTDTNNKTIITNYMQTDGWSAYVDNLFQGDVIKDLAPNQKNALYYAIRRYGLGIEARFKFDKQNQTFTCYIQ